jgi:hypothetical protein
MSREPKRLDVWRPFPGGAPIRIQRFDSDDRGLVAVHEWGSFSVDGLLREGELLEENTPWIWADNLPLRGLPALALCQLEDGDPVLLTGQAAPAENGLWIAHAGTWERLVAPS